MRAWSRDLTSFETLVTSGCMEGRDTAVLARDPTPSRLQLRHDAEGPRLASYKSFSG